jgi:hypothetical protein
MTVAGYYERLRIQAQQEGTSVMELLARLNGINKGPLLRETDPTLDLELDEEAFSRVYSPATIHQKLYGSKKEGAE